MTLPTETDVIALSEVNDFDSVDDVLLTVADDATKLYPSFQFHEGVPAPRLSEIIEILQGSGRDNWSIALWLLTSPCENNTRGKTFIELFHNGEYDLVRTLAIDSARRFVSS